MPTYLLLINITYKTIHSRVSFMKIPTYLLTRTFVDLVFYLSDGTNIDRLVLVQTRTGLVNWSLVFPWNQEGIICLGR